MRRERVCQQTLTINKDKHAFITKLIIFFMNDQTQKKSTSFHGDHWNGFILSIPFVTALQRLRLNRVKSMRGFRWESKRHRITQSTSKDPLRVLAAQFYNQFIGLLSQLFLSRYITYWTIIAGCADSKIRKLDKTKTSLNLSVNKL